MKRKVPLAIPLIIGIIFIIVSLSALMYPTIVNIINTKASNTAIDNYSKQISAISEDERMDILTEATQYNEQLKSSVTSFSYSTESSVIGYEEVLSFDDGIIGYIEIPKIELRLPIYHGSSESCLSKGAAHLPNTAFPVGGKGNHTVLAAHTAYANQIFFDHIDQLNLGDEIFIKIVGQENKYIVKDINIVYPTDTSKCQPVIGRDLLSLVTCYPYAQNTHRLIVTAERVISATPDATEEQYNGNSSNDENKPTPVIKANDEKILGNEIIIVYLIIFILVIFLCAFIVIMANRRKKKDEKSDKHL